MINTQHFVGLSEKFWEDINWFESLSRSTQTFPPYDLLRIDEDNAVLEFALAGYDKETIDITVKPTETNVRILEVCGGASDDENTEESYEHRGIARRKFTARIPLSQYWEVSDAKMSNGILSVNLHRNIPEEKKPVTISIK
jgi:molecular chaperone IbpA|tara:strand:+ start:759 stop:1181 length:423 start_codon:yes stop_codon:yes gene_type:complete